MNQVAARELNQRTAEVLARVEGGETVEVTRHGRVIGRIVPAGAPVLTELDDWVADGCATPGTRTGPWTPPTADDSAAPDAATLVRQLRDEERW